jgi:hypothetical protein
MLDERLTQTALPSREGEGWTQTALPSLEFALMGFDVEDGDGNYPEGTKPEEAIRIPTAILTLETFLLSAYLLYGGDFFDIPENDIHNLTASSSAWKEMVQEIHVHVGSDRGIRFIEQAIEEGYLRIVEEGSCVLTELGLQLARQELDKYIDLQLYEETGLVRRRL